MARKGTRLDKHQVRLPNLVILGLFLFSPHLIAKEILIDGVRAVVNGKPILNSQIQEKINVGPLVTVSDYPSGSNDTPANRALNDSINFELISTAAKESDIEIEDADVESEINRFLKMQQNSKAQLMDFLKKQGKSYDDYKRDFAKQLLLQQFQRTIILPRVKVTDKDIEAFYQTKRGVVDPGQVTMTVQQIIIAKNDPAQVERIHNKIKSSKDFNNAVNQYSDGPKGEGSYIKNLKLTDLAPNIQQALANLEKGQTSDLVQSPAGFHVFYVVSKKARKLESSDFEKLKPRLEAELKNKKLFEQTNGWLVEAREKARVKINDKKS